MEKGERGTGPYRGSAPGQPGCAFQPPSSCTPASFNAVGSCWPSCEGSPVQGRPGSPEQGLQSLWGPCPPMHEMLPVQGWEPGWMRAWPVGANFGSLGLGDTRVGSRKWLRRGGRLSVPERAARPLSAPGQAFPVATHAGGLHRRPSVRRRPGRDAKSPAVSSRVLAPPGARRTGRAPETWPHPLLWLRLRAQGPPLRPGTAPTLFALPSTQVPGLATRLAPDAGSAPPSGTAPRPRPALLSSPIRPRPAPCYWPHPTPWPRLSLSARPTFPVPLPSSKPRPTLRAVSFVPVPPPPFGIAPRSHS